MSVPILIRLTIVLWMIGTHSASPVSAFVPVANRSIKSRKSNMDEICPVSYPKRKPPMEVTAPRSIASTPQSAPLTRMELGSADWDGVCRSERCP